MAMKSCRKMDGENPSLRKRFEAHGVAGILLSPGFGPLAHIPAPPAAGRCKRKRKSAFERARR